MEVTQSEFTIVQVLAEFDLQLRCNRFSIFYLLHLELISKRGAKSRGMHMQLIRVIDQV